MTLNWVACGTCCTKTEGTELGGLNALKLDFPKSTVGRANPKIERWPGDRACSEAVGELGEIAMSFDR